MILPPQVEFRPYVMMGKACLRGTRIPVYLILEKLAAGELPTQILAAYPHLTAEHISAALQYAASMVEEEIVLAS